MSYYPLPNSNLGSFPVTSPPYQNIPAGNVPQYPPSNNLSPGYPAAQQPNVMAYPATSGYPTPGMSPNQPQPGPYGQYPNPGGMSPNQPQPGAYGQYPNPGGVGMPQTGVQQPAVCPSAPDIGQMEKIPGYEGIGFEDAILPPPTIPTWQPEQQDRQPLQNLPVLSDEEVHDAVIQFSSEHCCYSSKVARDMQVREIVMMSAFHYKLETFTEKRESAWRFLPYHGQAIDGPSNGPAPNPWNVTAMPPSSFQNSRSKLEVPHTAFVKPCHACVGNGRVRCETCVGQGRKQCTWCKGRGRRTDFDRNEPCTSCNSTGWDRCFQCSATGQVKCKTCDGRGNLKGYVELTVSWTNHVDDFISDTSRMPKELVLQVTGQVAYEEENPRVFPITHATEQAVRNASNDLVTKHSSAFTNERILKQRQCLRVIPIGHVRYEWKDKMDEFFVYGYEHKVYFKKYPQKCSCTIM